MKIFISWSGELSKKIAESIKKWLPCFINMVDVFFSPDDIEKGENWDNKIAKELSECKYGIICLTKENVTAQWINFEAGAIAKTLDSRVATLMVNINPSDVKGPLSRYQATKMEKDDFFQLVENINNQCDTPVNKEVLKNTFDGLWDKMMEDLLGAVNNYKRDIGAKNKKEINNAEAIEEILQLVRGQSAIINDPTKLLPQDYIRYTLKESYADNRKIDEFFDALYMHTRKFISEQYSNEEITEVKPFVRNYMDMIYAICRDYPIWMRRFSRMFREYRHHYINDETEI